MAKLFQTLPNPRHIGFLLMRYWMEYRQLWKALIVRDFLDRFIFLLAFGFGLGSVVPTMGGVPYLTYLVPGIACSAGAFVMTMAMTYGVWERFTNLQVWQAWLATPIRLHEVMIAELLYAALRSMPAVAILYATAYACGALPHPLGALLSLPVILLTNLACGAVALCFTAHIRRVLYFTYVATLWTTPMYLFANTFFDTSNAPAVMHALSHIFPLTYAVQLVRPMVIGQPVDPQTLALSVGVLSLLSVGGFLYSYRRFAKRIVS